MVKEHPAEQAGQDPDRQEEAGLAGDPPAAVGRDPAARHEAMQVGVVQQGLTPGVQHAEEADLGAEVGRVGGDPAQGLGRGMEQDVVDHRLVLEGDDGDLVRHREDDVEVGSIEQLRLAVRQPLGAGEGLALGAVPVAAGVVGDALVAAVITLLDMAAERGRPAEFDRAHGVALHGGQRTPVLLPVCLAVAAEHVRHLQGTARHGPGA